ncbi:MAG: nucleotidyltransferase substrate binding protein [Alphaproteobacteria bacterium]|nr:MAG: hypothetical protein B6I23_01085 [Rickettsiaceae bacterium 4572_127]
MTNYIKLKNSLCRLKEMYRNYKESNADGWQKEALRESCIHRFETCFDSLWKHLKKHLQDKIGLSDLPNGPKPIFRLAGENKLIENVESFFNYNNKRIATSHDCSEEKANETLEIIEDFITDTSTIYKKISGDNAGI